MVAVTDDLAAPSGTFDYLHLFAIRSDDNLYALLVAWRM